MPGSPHSIKGEAAGWWNWLRSVRNRDFGGIINHDDFYLTAPAFDSEAQLVSQGSLPKAEWICAELRPDIAVKS